jgi:twitching motility protein PilT
MLADGAVALLGKTLVEQRLVSEDDLARAVREAEVSGVHPARALLAAGRLDPVQVLRAAAGGLSLEFVDPDTCPPDADALQRLGADLAMAKGALPVRRVAQEDGDALVVALADPLNRAKVSLLAEEAGCPVVPALAPCRSLSAAVARAYANRAVRAPSPAESRVGEAPPEGEEAGYHLNQLLEVVLDTGSSDLHLTAGSPPLMRLDGQIQPIEGYGRLQPGPLRTLIFGILSTKQREQLEERQELDCSHPVAGKGRFRVNVFYQRGSVGAVLRAIPEQAYTLEELGMPPTVAALADQPRGLVLVTGSTGQGKSTTLAALIDLINRTRPVHIMTVEDPIEYMHHHKMAIVNQREVGTDTPSFASALRHALRQDPDVILVGELRDLETMATALTAAETGHLVFATLHTQDAPGSVERMIDVFPPHQQQQVRVQLASSLQGVVSQQLLPLVSGRGRVAAVEVLVATPAVRNLIREGKVHQIRSAIQAGGKHGMQTMEQSLAQLVKAGKVSMNAALERASNPEEFSELVRGARR